MVVEIEVVRTVQIQDIFDEPTGLAAEFDLTGRKRIKDMRILGLRNLVKGRTIKLNEKSSFAGVGRCRIQEFFWAY